MLDGITPIGPNGQVGSTRKAAGPAVPPFRVPAQQGARDGIPTTPPPEVLAGLDKAARVLDELAAKQVNLHFETDGHRIKVEVRDGTGRVLREIPPSRMLDVLGGDHSALALDAKA